MAKKIMSRRRNTKQERYICLECGNPRLITRHLRRQRKHGHTKTMTCFVCNITRAFRKQ